MMDVDTGIVSSKSYNDIGTNFADNGDYDKAVSLPIFSKLSFVVGLIVLTSVIYIFFFFFDCLRWNAIVSPWVLSNLF